MDHGRRWLESYTAAEEVVGGIDAFEDSLRRMQDVVDDGIDEELLGKTSEVLVVSLNPKP